MKMMMEKSRDERCERRRKAAHLTVFKWLFIWDYVQKYAALGTNYHKRASGKNGKNNF